MGLFSRDTEIYVASLIYPLNQEPDKIPDLVKASIITAALQKRATPAQAIRRCFLEGKGVKLSQAFAYARSGKYHIDLPTDIPAQHDSPNDLILNILCKEYLARIYPLVTNIELTTVAVQWGMKYDLIAQQLIEAAYFYDFYEPAVMQASGNIDVDATLVYNRLPDDSVNFPNQVGYQLVFTNPDLTVETINAWWADSNFTNADIVARRIVMQVRLDGARTITLIYEYGGADARLNIFLREITSGRSSTFPAIVLKKPDGKYLNTNAFTGSNYKTSSAYTTSRAYARRLELNIDDLIAGIKSSADEAKISYAFVQPGTLPQATNQAPIEYHFNYFNRLRLSFPPTKADYLAWRVKAVTGSVVKREIAEGIPTQTVHFYDPDTAQVKDTLNMEVGWRYIDYQVKTGVLSNGKKFQIECGPQEIDLTKHNWVRVPKVYRYDVTKLWIRKQLTANTYAELEICGLAHENYIFKGESVVSTAWDAFNDPDGDYGTGFIIPLDYEVFMSMSARGRLQLGEECLHVVFNCYKVVKEKWYQTGFFRFVMMVITLVIVAYSFGSASSLATSLYGTITAKLAGIIISTAVLAAVAAILTALIMVALYAGVAYLAGEAGEWAADQWGPAWGAVVQIVAAIVLSYGLSSGLNSYMGTTATAPAPIGVAEQALMATSYLVMGLSSYTKFAMEDLKDEVGRWQDYINGPKDALEEVNKLLEELFPTLNLGQEAILSAPRETLEEWLGRTLTLTDGLTGRLFLPITSLTELTLTPRLQ